MRRRGKFYISLHDPREEKILLASKEKISYRKYLMVLVLAACSYFPRSSLNVFEHPKIIGNSPWKHRQSFTESSIVSFSPCLIPGLGR